MHLEERFHLNALRLCGRVVSGSGASLRHVCNCRAHWFAELLSVQGLSWARDAHTYTLDRRPPVVIAGAGGVAGVGETDVIDGVIAVEFILVLLLLMVLVVLLVLVLGLLMFCVSASVLSVWVSVSMSVSASASVSVSVSASASVLV